MLNSAILELFEALVKELADLRFAFATWAQEEFIEFLPRLFPSGENRRFPSLFEKLIEEQVSLNTLTT